jgi:protein SCO1/2
MTPRLKTTAACLVVACIGASGLWVTTDNGRALTIERARRLRVLDVPAPTPKFVFTDRHGREARLHRGHNSITLLEFIYTTCPVICQSGGAAFLRLQERLQQAGLTNDVRLLSVSFDLEQDGPVELEMYEKRHQVDGRRWRIVKPLAKDLSTLLETFGVVVLPDPIIGFEHNAAIHVVSGEGRLVGIFDLDDIDGVMKRLTTLRQGRS